MIDKLHSRPWLPCAQSVQTKLAELLLLCCDDADFQFASSVLFKSDFWQVYLFCAYLASQQTILADVRRAGRRCRAQLQESAPGGEVWVERLLIRDSRFRRQPSRPTERSALLCNPLQPQKGGLMIFFDIFCCQ